MPVYEYSALNSKGKTTAGIIDAESALAARQKLRSSKIFPVSIKETRKSQASKPSWMVSLQKSFARVKPSEITLMTRQMATLVGAGFPLVAAMDTMLSGMKAQGIKKILAQIKDAIVEGSSFANAMVPYSGIFSPVYINMVRAGETSGTLEIVLDRLADIMEKQQALKGRIRSALAYPCLMLLVGAGVLIFLVTYVLPSIATIFEDMGQNLPFITRALMGSSAFIKSYWWVILILAGAVGIGFHRMIKSEKGRFIFDRTVLSMPVMGGLIKRLAVARFARTLGSLLENGVTMLTALEIVKNIVNNRLLGDAVDKAAEEVGKGQGLGIALADTTAFPNLSIQMIQVGEQSGELEKMLEKIAEVYENEVETTIGNLTAILEPVMILAMAVAVAVIVVSIVLPILEMNELVR